MNQTCLRAARDVSRRCSIKRPAVIVQMLLLLSLSFALQVCADDPTSRYVTLSPISTTALPPTSSGIQLQFELWDSATGGTQISVEAHTVDTDANANITNDTGFSDLLFGRPVGLAPGNFPSGSSRYLDVTQGGSTVLAARMPLYASPFTISPASQTMPSLLHHASFQGASQTVVGTNSRIVPFDGVVFLQTDLASNGLADLTSDPADTAPFPGLDRPGAYLSLRLKNLSQHSLDQASYFVAGGTDNFAAVLRNGFGFKYVGDGSNGHLNGVTILNGSETLVDLATTIGFLTTDPPADLLAIRRAASVDFYVNGVLKGSSTANLPSTANSIYELRIINNSHMGHQSWAVSFLTVGVPVF